MHNTPTFKSLREIKQSHGFPSSSPLANWLRELVLTYNQSQQKYTVISHTQANIFTQKVKHDSFSQSLNRTILNLETLICNDCFPSSNCEHSNLSTVNSKAKAEKSPAVIYRHYTDKPSMLNRLGKKRNRKQIKQFKKGWQELIRDSLLLDLYKAYVVEMGDSNHPSPKKGVSAPALHFINDVLRHFSSATLLPKMRLNPPVPTLPPSSFRSLVKRYQALAE